MRTTIDIPDAVYREIKIRAATEGRTVRDIVLEAVAMRVGNDSPPSKRLKLPFLHSMRTDKLDIDSEKIYEIIDFP